MFVVRDGGSKDRLYIEKLAGYLCIALAFVFFAEKKHFSLMFVRDGGGVCDSDGLLLWDEGACSVKQMKKKKKKKNWREKWLFSEKGGGNCGCFFFSCVVSTLACPKMGSVHKKI